MARIKPPETAFRPGKQTRRVERKDHLMFIRQLPCVSCQTMRGVQAAHLSTFNDNAGHYGRGKGSKASDRWTLPLCEGCHTYQHKIGEEKFWERIGDPWIMALVLFGIHIDADALGDTAFSQPFAEELIKRRKLYGMGERFLP